MANTSNHLFFPFASWYIIEGVFWNSQAWRDLHLFSRVPYLPTLHQLALIKVMIL